MAKASDDLVIDEARFEIRRDGMSIPVEPKVFDLIRLLSRNAGRVLSREELRRAIWPGQHVTDASLRRAVGEARRALGPWNRIVTLPRRGLSWVEVQASAPNSERRNVVGRRPELDELLRTWTSVNAGAAACVFVSGEAGIGKTTLLDAFSDQLSHSATHVTAARASCDLFEGLAEPHQVWLRLLGDLVGRGSAGRRALGVLRRVAPNWSAQLPGEAPVAAPPTHPRERLLRELAAFLSALADRRPLVLVLDDLHAADASSLDLLFGLIRLRLPGRILLLGAYRPHETAARPLDAEVHALRLRRLAHAIQLGALAVEDVARYAATRMETSEPQIALLAELLHRRSEGNPLFFTALLDGWIERGALVRGSSAFAADELAEDFPDSLDAVIALELAKLAPSARTLLHGASVSGIEFEATTAAVAASAPAENAKSELETLARRGRFVCRLAFGGSRYGFRHALLRDALYRNLTVSERREMHLRVAFHLEALAASPADLARHFELGGEPSRALPLRIAAAVSAGARFGYQEAALHLRGAVEALRGSAPACRARDEQELQLQLGLVMALGASGSASDSVLAALKRAESLCSALGDHQRRLLILAGLWNCQLTRSDLASAASIAGELLAFSENGQPGLANLAHLLIGISLFYQGDRIETARHLERVLDDEPEERQAARSLFEDVDPGVVARAYLAWLRAIEGRMTDSDAARAEAIALASSVGGPQGQALALAFSAALLAERGDAAAARAEAERALRVADEFGLRQWSGVARVVSGYAGVLAHENEPGFDELEGGIADYHATGARVSTSFLLSLRARALSRLGRRAEARATLDAANAHCERTGERYYAETLRLLERELSEEALPR